MQKEILPAQVWANGDELGDCPADNLWVQSYLCGAIQGATELSLHSNPHSSFFSRDRPCSEQNADL